MDWKVVMFEVFCVLLFVIVKTSTNGQTHVPITAIEEILRNMTLQGHASGTGNKSENIFCDFYTNWSKWTKCNRRCTQVRKKKCKKRKICGRTTFKEKRTCRRGNRKCPNHSLKIIGSSIKNRRMEDRLYDIFYKPWSDWGPCNKKCKRRRRRRCKRKKLCDGGYLEEQQPCRHKNGSCQTSYSFFPGIDSSKTRKSPKKAVERPKHNITFAELQNICGARPEVSTKLFRILGGRDSVPHSWPWQVEILIRKRKHFCGGTLIAPYWVLTAAHCIHKRGKHRRVTVRVGEHNTSIKEGTETDIKVKNYHLYPSFDYKSVLHDIALLELSSPVFVTNYTGYACLPHNSFKVKRGTLCHTMGWGRTKITNRKGSKILQEVAIPVVKKKKCKKAFTFTITNSQLCAGYAAGGKDACVGDSGGPLMCPEISRKKDNKWYVTGVTSYGDGCGEKNKFGIYTNVGKYISWIKSLISKKL